MTDTERDIGEDLKITKITPRWEIGGVWVRGTLNGHRFEALVFRTRAQRSEWELHGGRISKLQLLRLADKEIVFEWDRGIVLRAQTELAGDIVDFLAAGLADHLFPQH